MGVELEVQVGIELNYTNLVDFCKHCIIADPEQLKRVINNIISNLVKSTDKRKRKEHHRHQDT